MTFFDWNANPDQPRVVMLWLYFAVAVPLTIIVVLLWLLFTKSTRERLAGSLNVRHKQRPDVEKVE